MNLYINNNERNDTNQSDEINNKIETNQINHTNHSIGTIVTNETHVADFKSPIQNVNRFSNPCFFPKPGDQIIIKRSKAIKYYKLTVQMANLFSKDPSTKVGALFMYPGTLQILSMGYNDLYFFYIKNHFFIYK